MSPIFSVVRSVLSRSWFLAFLGMGALASAPLSAAITGADTSAPHFYGAPIKVTLNGTVDAGWDFVEGDYDTQGNYYTRGQNGIYSVGCNGYTLGPGQLLPSAETLVPQVSGGYAHSLSSFVAEYAPTLPVGSWIHGVTVNAFGWVDGHWQEDGSYDEDGNWNAGDDTWCYPIAGASFMLGLSFPLSVVNGGSTAQTITWTTPPPNLLAWNDTAPRAIAATSSSGQPVKFSFGPTTGYPGAFSLNGNLLTYSGMVGYIGWIGTQWTVRAEAPSTATYGYASSLFYITLDKSIQTIPSVITGPTIHPYDDQLLYNVLARAGIGWVGVGTWPVYARGSGGGIVDDITSPIGAKFRPMGWVGTATFMTYYGGNEMSYQSNIATMSIVSWAPPQPPWLTPLAATQTVATGGSVTFSVEATGVPGPSLQWLKNGVAIPGANSTSLTLTNAQSTDAGGYSVFASSSSGTYTTNTCTLTVIPNPSAPTIISAAAANASTNATFTYSILATNSPTDYAASGLPAGLVRTGNVISGRPTQIGSFAVTISATNASGTASTQLLLTIADGLPVILGSNSVAGVVGSNFYYAVSATNSPSSYSATGLPAGLNFNPATGEITGTPLQAGTSMVVIRATNVAGYTEKQLTIGIAAVGAPVTVPVALPPTQVQSTRFLANWSPVPGATSYRLDVSTSPTFSNPIEVDPVSNRWVTGTSFSMLGVNSTSSYYYRVRAVTGVGTSLSSNVITLAGPRTFTNTTPPASIWLDVPRWVRNSNNVWEPVYDGLLDEVIPVGASSQFNYYIADWYYTGGTITFEDYDYDPNLDWFMQDVRASYEDASDIHRDFNNYWNSSYIVYYPGEFYFRLAAEFAPSGDYDYDIRYSKDSVLTGTSLQTVNGGEWQGGGTPGVLQTIYLFNPFTGPELNGGSLYLVRRSFAPGGCVIGIPGIGSVSAGAKGSVAGTATLGGVKVTAATSTNSTATLEFPNGAKVSVASDGSVATITGSVPDIYSVSASTNGNASMTLPNGTTIAISSRSGEVTLSATGGGSITVGKNGIKLSLPQGATSAINDAIDTDGKPLGIDTRGSNIRTSVDNHPWESGSGGLGSLGIGDHNVRTTSDQRTTPSDENMVSITVTITPAITTTTLATQPSNRQRRRIGIGEEVKIVVSSPSDSNVTWVLSAGHGIIERRSDDPPNGATLTAADKEETIRIEATLTNYSNVKVPVDFNVVTPKVVSFVLVSDPSSSIQLAAPPGLKVQYSIDYYYGPDDVCFYNIVPGETGASYVGNIGGWFE